MKTFKIQLESIDILKVLDIPATQVPEELLEFIKDFETYTDTEAFNEHMYSVALFNSPEYNWPTNLIDYKEELLYWMNQYDCSYVRFIV